VVAGMTQLKTGLFEGNLIVDISPLTGLTGLQAINLKANPLAAEAFTKHIPAIEKNNPGVQIEHDP
jgi:hypothetical protein